MAMSRGYEDLALHGFNASALSMFQKAVRCATIVKHKCNMSSQVQMIAGIAFACSVHLQSSLRLLAWLLMHQGQSMHACVPQV